MTVYGDSNCLDSSHNLSNCYWLLQRLLNFTNWNVRDPIIFAAANELTSPIGGPDTILPARRDDVNLTSYSLVLVNNIQCGLDSPFEVQGTQGYVKIGQQFNRIPKADIQHPGTGGKHVPLRVDVVGQSDNKGLNISVIPSQGAGRSRQDRKAPPEEPGMGIGNFPRRDEVRTVLLAIQCFIGCKRRKQLCLPLCAQGVCNRCRCTRNGQCLSCSVSFMCMC